MAITYQSGPNLIIVTGYTEAVPCTFHDIKLADTAGGWGVVDEYHGNQFWFRAKLEIGDGIVATWFADKEKQVGLEAILFDTWERWIEVKNHAHFSIGVLKDLATKSTKQGGSFVSHDQDSLIWVWIYGDTTADVNLYSTQFTCVEAGTYAGWIHTRNSSNRIWNCIFCGEGAFNGITGGGIGNFYNLLIQDGFSGLGKAEGTFEKIYITGCTYGVHWYQDKGGDLLNATIKDCDYSFDINTYSANFAAINTICDWTFHWFGVSTGKIYRKYKVDLKVQKEDETAIPSAAVKIWDLGDNLVVNTTTDANGEIATQTLSYGYYDYQHGDTCLMATPHIMEITKPGYQTYKTKFSVDEVIDWRIKLLEVQAVQFCDNDLILQLRPESIKGDRFLYTKI